VNAYDEGYGHGIALDRTPNRYPLGASDHEQYARGYAAGAEQSGAPPGQRILSGPEARNLWPFELELLRQDLRDSVADPTCPHCVGERWMCEEHPERRFGHIIDGKPCPGPGIPCKCNPDQLMPPGFKAHCSVDGNQTR
jgi:hypothetical protein